MFEHTLAGSMPQGKAVRVGPVTAALILHAGVLIALAAVSLLTLRPVRDPVPQLDVVFPTLPPLEPEGKPAGVAPARRSSGPSRPALEPPEPPKPPESQQPEFVPDSIPDVVSSSQPPIAESIVGEGEGGGNGLGNGPPGGNGGPGDGPGGGGTGAGNGTGTGPLSVGGSVVSPRLIVKVEPEYPSLARKIRLEGRVVLRAVVGPDGGVTNVEVVSSTNPVFDAAAQDAVRRWRYTAPTQDGRPVSVWFTIVVKFTLH